MKAPDVTFKGQRGGKTHHMAQVMSQLLTENEKLKSRLAQAERERDAAKLLNDDLVKFAKYLEEQLAQSQRKIESCLFDFWATVSDKSMTGTCHTCKHDKTCDKLPGCYWKWRGVCAENTKEEEK